MQIMHFILGKILKIMALLHAFLSSVVTKTVRFFGPPCTLCSEKNTFVFLHNS